MSEPAPLPDYSISVKDLCRMLNTTRYAIYKWLKAGQFPQPVTFSYKCVRWKADDVEHWLRCRALKQEWKPLQAPAQAVEE